MDFSSDHEDSVSFSPTVRFDRTRKYHCLPVSSPTMYQPEAASSTSYVSGSSLLIQLSGSSVHAMTVPLASAQLFVHSTWTFPLTVVGLTASSVGADGMVVR